MSAGGNVVRLPRPVSREPEDRLALLIPELVEAERLVQRLRGHVDRERRALAAKRGVAFIREERVRQEFGGEPCR